MGLNKNYDEVDSETSKVDELFNDEEANKDISQRPLDMVRTNGMYRQVIWQSLDGMGITTNGVSPTVDNNTLYYPMPDGGGENAEVVTHMWNQGHNYGSWDKETIIKFSYIWSYDSGNFGYMTLGDVRNGKKGFGIYSSGSAAYAVTHDGTTKNQTQIESNINRRAFFMIHLVPGDRIDYYYDNTSTPTLTQTKNLPSGSGTSMASRFFTYAQNNDTNSNTRNLNIHPFELARAPY